MMCFSVTTALPFSCSPPSPARPLHTPACCPPALQWTGGVTTPTHPRTCRHTWTVNPWAPQVPPPQVSFTLCGLHGGGLFGFFCQLISQTALTIYLKTSWTCVPSFLGKTDQKGNSVRVVSN
jgi:hypothetical protein